jgi:hypothetical protein
MNSNLNISSADDGPGGYSDDNKTFKSMASRQSRISNRTGGAVFRDMKID